MTNKPRIPKDINDLEQYFHGGWTYKARVVPDDLLSDRFAFDGSIVLNKKETKAILIALDNLTSGKYAAPRIPGSERAVFNMLKEKYLAETGRLDGIIKPMKGKHK